MTETKTPKPKTKRVWVAPYLRRLPNGRYRHVKGYWKQIRG